MATIEAQICEEHARAAAFLWLLRDHAVRDVAYDLAGLSELDERLEAHLDGLRLAGEAGFEACKVLLEKPEGGEVFGAAVLAIERWDLRGLARVLDVGAGAPDLARGLVSALGWTPFERVERLLPGLLAGRCPPALHWLGISACAAHRRDPGPALGYAIVAGDARLRARALRAAGELGRIDLLPEIRAALDADKDGESRFWAAWSAARFGEAASAPALFWFARSETPFAARAADMAMRCMDPAVAYSWLHALAHEARDPRAPIAGAAALGDVTIVPWLIEQMQAAEAARPAAFALSMITGVDLDREKLTAKPPEGFRGGPTDEPGDEDVSMDPDESLPWPDVAGVTAWWRARAGDFRRGTRYLLGGPRTTEHLEKVLCTGSQPARAAAALELGLTDPRRAVFEVRGPGFLQQRALGGHR